MKRSVVALLLLFAIIGRADVEIEIHESIQVTRANPDISRAARWVWIETTVTRIGVSGPTGGGTGSSGSSTNIPTECNEPVISIVNMRIKPKNVNTLHTTGIFRWGDEIIADVSVSSSSPITIQEMAIEYTLDPNSGTTNGVQHTNSPSNFRLPTYNVKIPPSEVRTKYGVNSTHQPTFDDSNKEIVVTPFLSYVCKATGQTGYVSGQSLRLTNIYYRAPYYEIKRFDDCPAGGPYTTSYYTQAGNYKLTKPCGTTITVTRETQDDWKRDYSTQNTFSAGVSVELQSAGEAHSEVELVESNAFGLSGTVKTTSTVTLESGYSYYMGVERRIRHSNWNAWAVSDDLQRWEKVATQDIYAVYDWLWTITAPCPSGTATPSPINLGKCTTF